MQRKLKGLRNNLHLSPFLVLFLQVLKDIAIMTLFCISTFHIFNTLLKLYCSFSTHYLPSFPLAQWVLQDLAMKLSSLTNLNAVSNFNASFPDLSLNPTASSALKISSSAENCSSFSAVCMLGKICYTLQLHSVAENVNFCLSYSSHSMYAEPWFSVWLCPESLASLSWIYVLALNTNGCHCSDFSLGQLLCYWHVHAFPQGWRWFSWYFLLQTEITCLTNKAVSD